MTVNLMQMDERGKESITSMFRDPEEQEFMDWITGLESACPGVTIFVHRLSDPGFYLCTVPASHACFAEDGNCPPRFCGCFDCIDRRRFNREHTAWNISTMARAIAYEIQMKQRFMGKE